MFVTNPNIAWPIESAMKNINTAWPNRCIRDPIVGNVVCENRNFIGPNYNNPLFIGPNYIDPSPGLLQATTGHPSQKKTVYLPPAFKTFDNSKLGTRW